MGASRLPMRPLHEILRLKHEGLPHRAIARACGVGVGTVSVYVRRAEPAGWAGRCHDFPLRTRREEPVAFADVVSIR